MIDRDIAERNALIEGLEAIPLADMTLEDQRLFAQAIDALRPRLEVAPPETLGRIQSETDDGILYVDTGFGSQLTTVRPGSAFLKELQKTPLGARASSVIHSYLFLILECSPNIPGCDADEQERRLKALLKALETKRPKKRKSSANYRVAPPTNSIEQPHQTKIPTQPQGEGS